MAFDAFLYELGLNNLRVVRIQLNPSRWQKFCDDHKLTWEFIPFESNLVDQIPELPGMYCFYIGHNLQCLPKLGLSLYGGIATKQTLKARFKNYLREKNSPNGRINVRKFLNVFEGELFFGWVISKDTSTLAELEKAFNDAMMPPYSIRDFSAEVRKGRNAWQ
ncbi:MAG: hypothetical protein OXH57_09720 [Ekhidna sp.]|nr:hypothetical protein [Ekhidna sp.]